MGTEQTSDIAINTLAAYFTRYGWGVDRLDDTTHQSGFAHEGVEVSLVAQVDNPYVYFRLFPSPAARLAAGTDHKRLLRLNEQVELLKLSIDAEERLVVAAEYLDIRVDAAVFEVTLTRSPASSRSSTRTSPPPCG